MQLLNLLPLQNPQLLLRLHLRLLTRIRIIDSSSPIISAKNHKSRSLDLTLSIHQQHYQRDHRHYPFRRQLCPVEWTLAF